MSKQNVIQTIKDSFDQIRAASRAIVSARPEAAAAADDDDNEDDMILLPLMTMQNMSRC